MLIYWMVIHMAYKQHIIHNGKQQFLIYKPSGNSTWRAGKSSSCRWCSGCKHGAQEMYSMIYQGIHWSFHIMLYISCVPCIDITKDITWNEIEYMARECYGWFVQSPWINHDVVTQSDPWRVVPPGDRKMPIIATSCRLQVTLSLVCLATDAV